MKQQNSPASNTTKSNQAVHGLNYQFSPKIVVIAGPPAGGKSYAAKLLAENHGYALLRLDAITPLVANKYGGDIETVRQPGTYQDFKDHFAQLLRKHRYQNIVLEGCRMSHPHIHQGFMDALHDIYSPYTIVQNFYLNPSREVRMEHFLLRKIRQAKQAIKGGNTNVNTTQVFCDMLEPVLPSFSETEDSEAITQWAIDNQDVVHPGVPEEDYEVFKTVAEAESFNPFYQTIEYNGRTLVPGFTLSPLAWQNILKLDVDFNGKSLCDYGCMHGYYTFKAEEEGAVGIGVDMDQGAVNLSNYLASVKKSNCHFMVYDITTPLSQKYDIILALNVLHRTGKFELTTKVMFGHCNECILEVGESQLPIIIGEGTRQGFKLKRNIPSHRQQSCIGPRRVLHMVRQEGGK